MPPLTPLPAWLDRSRFPFQPRLIPLPSGESLSVTEVGQGTPVLLVHGTPTWSYEWRHLLRELKGFRLIAPDHLGFGLSPRPPGASYAPEAHAERLEELVQALGLERFHLVVHDFGGPIGLDVALRHPERVLSLTAFNTFAWSMAREPRSAWMAWLAGTPLFRWLYGVANMSFVISRSAWGDPRTVTPQTWPPYLQVFPDHASRRLVLFALARSLSASSDWAQSLWERRARLADVPVCLVWGLKDTAFPPWTLERLLSAWPSARVHRLPEAGHWPHEEQPEVCVAAVRDFLASVTT